VTSPNGPLPLALRALGEVALLLGVGIQGEHVIEEGSKLGQFQACDGKKHSWIAM